METITAKRMCQRLIKYCRSKGCITHQQMADYFGVKRQQMGATLTLSQDGLTTKNRPNQTMLDVLGLKYSKRVKDVYIKKGNIDDVT